MADNILRLRVDSQEYDAKLKKAAEGIRHLADVAHQGGGELTGLEKAELDYIKSLGTMETKSRTAAGSVRELENTYKELKVIYDQLNEVEKADEGGKALAASLETLKQRAQDARASLDNASKSLNDNGQSAQQSGSILESLAGKFTLNIDALKLFDMGLSVTKAALDVAKDAFFASEANVDEWGRTVAASQSLYEGFLTAINNGDISGYLNNIDSIVNAARLAYDELDKLGTMKTIQAPKMSAQQTENERLRMMIQTGRYIAPIDGRKPSMKDGQLLTPAQIKTLERQLQNGMQSVVKLVGNEVKQTGKAIDAYYNSIAKQNGMSLQEFKKGTSSWDEFSKKMQGYQQYQKWRQENSFTDMYGNRQVREGNPYQEFKKWGTFRVDKMGENSFNDLVRLIQQRDQQAGQAYSMQSQAYRTMNRAEGVTVRQIMGGTGGKGGKGGTSDKNLDDEQKVQAKINALLKEALTADANRQGEIRKQVAELQKQQEKYKDIKNIAQGILPKDKEAVFTIDGQLTEETKKALSEIKGVTIDDKSLTITANTSDALKALQGIEGVTIDPKTVTITATDEALPKLREIEGITIDDKTMTVTAETADALRALQGIEGVTIDPKTVTITATDEAVSKLREIQGITIDDKSLTITANTSDALKALQGIEGVTIDPKSVTITATDEALSKLREIQGITIDDKTMTVTANTSDALKALQGIEGVTIDPKTVTITATDEALPKLREIQGITIDDKSLTITATDEALSKLREIQGITIDDKTMTVTAETADALRALQGIEGVTIDPKSVTITATDEALSKLREIQGITIDDKTMTVTAETADALRALQGIEGVTIDPKTVTITATDEALPKLREIQGITIDDKTMTVSAETSDALRALQAIEGVTINPKTVTITATDEALPKLREIEGITIDDKTMTVTANTSDALKALHGIEGVTIDPKTVTITATDEAVSKLREIQGITIDDKSLTITANTSDALKALQGIEGVTIDPKTVTITATDEALPKLREIQGITIDDKTMTVTANTQEAMQKVQELIGVVSETKLMPVKPVITDDDIDNILRKQYGQAIEVPITPKMSAGDELVQSIRLDLAQSIQDTDAQTLRTLLEAQIKNGIEGVEIPANSIIDQIFGEGVDIPDEYWRNLQEQINEKLREMNIDELNIDFGTGKDNGKDKKESDKKESKEEKKYLSEGLSQLSGGLNGLQSGFSQLGIDLGDGFGSVVQGLSGISSILMAIQTIVGAIEAISAVDSIIPFANGGIVRAAGGTLVGNSYSGDNLRGIGPDGQIYGLNAGEVVLNRSQVGNLASQLSGGGMQNLHLETYLDGRAIRIVLNNESQGRLKGKYVTSRRG